MGGNHDNQQRNDVLYYSWVEKQDLIATPEMYKLWRVISIQQRNQI